MDRNIGRGGGCLIYVSKDYPSTAFHNESTELLHESVWTAISMKANAKLLIGCAYRPPQTSPSADDDMCQAFIKISRLPFEFKVMGGDFNLPEISWANSSAPLKHQPLLTAL